LSLASEWRVINWFVTVSPAAASFRRESLDLPELPEVETIRRDLLPRVVGRTIAEVRVIPGSERLIQAPSPEELCRSLAGRRIENLSRHGKYLFFRLGDGRHLVVHLGMTGALLHRSSDAPRDAYERIIFELDDKSELRYTDLRKFGALSLVGNLGPLRARLGPDALADGFSAEALRSTIERRRAPIKAVMMDQAAVAGLGNIYSEEALFRARIRPQRAAYRLRKKEVARLHEAIGQVLHEAMGHRGSSFRDYVDADGREGQHQWHVRVYRRTDEPCYTCGRPIKRIVVGGRSTHFCPRCQK
jgi:formamidopyrimidine-DNA glycosylase